jgi:tetratricopeptide (TPR) repeat protein
MKKRKPAQSRGMTLGYAQEKDEMFKAISGALEQMNLSSPEDAQAFLDKFVGMKMSDITAALNPSHGDRTDEEKADDCFIEAMETNSRRACEKKLREALGHDPDHVRTLATLAFLEKKPEQVEQKLRHAIAAGERKLVSLLQEGHGQLWGFIEARPYMEARAQLAKFLADTDRIDESIEEHQRILELNENDNQGLRDPLLGLLIEAQRYTEARALVERYETSHCAVWLYGKALLKFLQCAEDVGWDTAAHDAAWLEQQVIATGKGMAPDLPKSVRKADSTIIKALKFNPWCAMHLLTIEQHLDDELPELYSPGSREEAVLFIGHQAGAWIKHPSAILWLGTTAMPWLVKNGFGAEFELG